MWHFNANDSTYTQINRGSISINQPSRTARLLCDTNPTALHTHTHVFVACARVQYYAKWSSAAPEPGMCVCECKLFIAFPANISACYRINILAGVKMLQTTYTNSTRTAQKSTIGSVRCYIAVCVVWSCAARA